MRHAEYTRVAPFTGAWIETSTQATACCPMTSRPSRARGLKREDLHEMQQIVSRALHGRVD